MCLRGSVASCANLLRKGSLWASIEGSVLFPPHRNLFSTPTLLGKCVPVFSERCIQSICTIQSFSWPALACTAGCLDAHGLLTLTPALLDADGAMLFLMNCSPSLCRARRKFADEVFAIALLGWSNLVCSSLVETKRNSKANALSKLGSALGGSVSAVIVSSLFAVGQASCRLL